MSDRSDLAAATQLVLDYLQARRDFEIKATQRFEVAAEAGDYEAALSEIQRDYDAVLAAFCAPNILKRRLRSHFGDPPTADPAVTQIESVTSFGQRTVVRTAEDIIGPPLGPGTVEYVLEQVDGSLRIRDRRTRGSDGRWIRFVV